MPAPSPIQIRYGPSGLLGQAVALAASGGAQQDRDWQFINSMTEQSNRSNAAMMDDALQSRRLQLAHGYRVAQEQNPDPGSYYSGATNPAATDAAGMALKNTYLTSAAADLPQDQAAQLKALIGNRNITPEQFRGVIFDATKKAKEKTDETTELEQRRNYVKAASEGLSPQDAATLASMAEDKKVNTAQLRTAADAIRGRNAVLQRHDVNLHAQGIDMKARQLHGTMASLAKSLAAVGVNPESTPPAALNPQYKTEIPMGNAIGRGFQNVNASFGITHPAQVINSDKSTPEVMQQYITYHKAKQMYDDLLAQREHLISGTGATQPSASSAATPPAAPASGGTVAVQGEGGWPVAEDTSKGVSIGPATGVKQLTPDIAAQFLQLARGDKNAARQMAAQQGYSF